MYKSKNKAAFERKKNDDEFKRKFDPFVFKEEVEQRNKTAQTTAVTVRLGFCCMRVLTLHTVCSACVRPPSTARCLAVQLRGFRVGRSALLQLAMGI